jgi:hypothetical protein
MPHDHQTRYQRRASDIEASKLSDMLEKENDESKRALLLVLSSLNANLMANTAATESIRKDLTAHLSSYQVHMEITTEYINKGKGAWKVVAWVLGLAQVLLIGIVASVHTDMRAFSNSITALESVSNGNERRLSSIERKLP